MRKSLAFLVGCVVLHAPPASALDTPHRSPYDSRVKAVVFNGDDVVQIDTVLGIATHIVLEEGETIVTHAFGDSDAYGFESAANHIFIKPKAEGADTNLVVVTSKRSYKFRLVFKETREGATYELLFRYPDTRRKATEEAVQKAEIETRFNDIVATNLAYTMSGDLELAPVNAWDDGRATYFKFRGGVDLPAIYVIGAGGEETVVDRTMAGAGNTVAVVPKVSARWVLRLGDRALGIWNEGYDATAPLPATGTASPFVTRVVGPGGDTLPELGGGK